MMYREYSKGIIEVITGPMFSGKSEELIKRIKILAHAKVQTLVVKPKVDDRWETEKIVSRAGNSIDTLSVKNVSDIKKGLKKKDYKAIAIDEAQFFTDSLISFVEDLANSGIRVIISGLDQDFKGQPFGIMPSLLAIADLVDKQTAVCQNCGRAATKSFRKSGKGKQVVVGDKEYEPLCRRCHAEGMQNH